MSTETEPPVAAESAPPAVPDFYTDPNAVTKDTGAAWRFGKRPDYSRTRAVYAECEYAQQTCARQCS